MPYITYELDSIQSVLMRHGEYDNEIDYSSIDNPSFPDLRIYFKSPQEIPHQPQTIRLYMKPPAREIKPVRRPLPSRRP